jgi:hypothetical protein
MFTACLIAGLLGAEPDFQITCKREDDSVEIATEAGRAVLTVASPRGIGVATVQRRQPHWPMAVILRLRLRGLESLTIAADQVTLGVSVSSSPPHPARLHVSQTGKQQEKAIDRSSRYWTEVRVLEANGKPASGLPAEGGRFELQLPAELLAGNPKTIEIRWIDFYRN